MDQETTQRLSQPPLREVNHTMQWNLHHQQYSPYYPLIFPPQTYQNSHAQALAYYQSYHYGTTNHPQPFPVPQITYPPAVPQITYPTQNNTNDNQVKIEPNPPLPPPLQQVQEPPQQPENFPTHDTILTITGGTNTNIEIKRQRRDYYRQVNHVVVEGPMTQTKWSHMPIAFSSQDVNLTSFILTPWSLLSTSIDGT
jgi:hypothetical protein